MKDLPAQFNGNQFQKITNAPVMLEITASWLSPLVLLPGVALLVLSTSVRFGQIHQEIHHLIESDRHVLNVLWNHLLFRAALFRNALVSLYISVALFTIATLVGGFASLLTENFAGVVFAITGSGIIFVLYGTAELIRESVTSLAIVREHKQELLKKR